VNRTYNADEVFEMAEQVERDGRSFYLRAADQTENPDVKSLLKDLAEMEKDHEKLFHNMRAEMQESGGAQVVYDPDQQAPLYLQSAAETHVFNVHQDIAQVLKGTESVEEVLRIAIGFEKDTVVFFLGLKDLVPEELGDDRIEGLIEEEMSHITTLTGQLRSLTG
jgi:rubrerythrin